MYIQPCTDDQWRVIYNEFNITEESLQNDASYLMDWMEKQPHLPNVKDEKFLRSILIHSKNSLERAKETLDKYYTLKIVHPEIFTNRNFSSAEFKKCYQLGQFIPMPKLTSDGYRVVIFRINPHDSAMIPSVDDFVKMLVTQLLLLMNFVPSRGLIVISDCKNYSLQFISFWLLTLKKLWSSQGNVFKSRQHKIYGLNISSVIEPVVILSKKLMRKDMSERTVFWKKNPEDLAEVIEKDFLPSDYGGNEKSVDELAELWYKELEGHNDWLIAEEEYKADISKRPRDSHMNIDLADYGADGTFRKMNLD